MNSSYIKKDIDYGELIQAITFSVKPLTIVEIGILNGYSLNNFINSSSETTIIKAYDIFDKFNGNHANESELKDKFKSYKNVLIEYGDFYKLHDSMNDKVDIIHIDIANTGDIFEYAIHNYLPKLSSNGILILEGGSVERDNVYWMHKYNKKSIKDVITSHEKILDIKTFGCMPSITLIKNSHSFIQPTR
jgi:hypothetical protein